MIGALAHVVLRQWRGHKLRVCLASLAVALGVGAFFAICTANAAVQQALRLTVERIAGKATLQVTAGEAGLPESVLEEVRQIPGVGAAEPVIEVMAGSPFLGEENVLLLGVDLAGSHPLHEIDADPTTGDFLGDSLEFIAQPDSLALPLPLAQRQGLGIGSKVLLSVPSGRHEFTVRGLFSPSGLAAAFGGNIAIIDVYSAQFVFSRGRTFDRIDLVNTPGTDVEALRERLKAALPSGLDVERPAMRGLQLESTVAAMQSGLLASSLVALLVAVYIILNAFTITLAQRRKELGVLRAIGVTRRDVIAMILGEAVLMGAAGALLGIAAGHRLAIHAEKLMSTIAGAAYGIAVTAATSIPLRIDYAAGAVLLGIASCALGAWLPARTAARLDPVRAMQDAEVRSMESAPTLAVAAVGCCLIMISTALILWSGPSMGVTRGLLLSGVTLLVGVGMVLPKLVRMAAQALRPLMDRLAGTEGALAVDAMIGAPRRSAAAVGAVVIGTTFVFSTGASIEGYKRLLQDWMYRVINADLVVVAASDDARSVRGHFPDEMGQRIAQVSGVERFERIRSTRIAYGGQRVVLVATDMEQFLLRARSALSDIDLQRGPSRLRAGQGVLVSGNFSAQWGLTPGQVLHLESPSGALDLEILGIVDDYRSEKGAIFVSRATYLQYWHDEAVDYFDIWLTRDADSAAVRHDLERIVSSAGSGMIYTNAEYRRWVEAQTDRYFLLSEVQLVIASVVALLGIVNTVAVSVIERRREIGLLRAVGAMCSQVRNQVLLEATVIALVGVIIGAAVSAPVTLFISRTVATAMGGFALPYVVPWKLMLLSMPIAVAAALMAGWWPARRAARIEVSRAISHV